MSIRKAFFELLGARAIHFGSGYVMFASDGIPAGGLFQDFLCSPGRAAQVPLLFSTLCFGSQLSTWSTVEEYFTGVLLD